MGNFRLKTILALPSLLILANCSPTVTPGTTSPASGTFTAVYTNTLSVACVRCHQPGGSGSSNLDFTTQAKAYSTLVNQSVSGTSSVGTCGAAKEVVPSSASTSYLPAVLFSSYRNSFNLSGCTPYNHTQDTSLSADEQTSLLTWITNGASNN